MVYKSLYDCGMKYVKYINIGKYEYMYIYLSSMW